MRKAACVQRKAPVRLTSTTLLPLLERELLERHRRRAGAGVVEQQVEAAEAGFHSLEQRPTASVG
jgi:Pyruvate/2-oxoacid:ferredoxin oxidoreductase gamma subunit